MANANFLHFLNPKLLNRKLQGAEFHDDWETFSQSQSKEEEEVIALISYVLVEQCENMELRKYPKM